jgi:hypothetical protein
VAVAVVKEEARAAAVELAVFAQEPHYQLQLALLTQLPLVLAARQ